jgi:hypothetical protein
LFMLMWSRDQFSGWWLADSAVFVNKCTCSLHLMAFNVLKVVFLWFLDMPKWKRNQPPPQSTSLLYPLLQPYSQLPDDASDFKNGHVIYIFKNHGHSPTTTVNILKEHHVPATVAQVLNLVQSSVKAFPNLRRESDSSKLSAILWVMRL